MRNNSIFQPSPSSPRNWAPDAFPPVASIAVALGAVVVYFVTLVVLLRAFRVTPQSIVALELTPAIVKAQVLSYVPILAYMAIALPMLARKSIAELLGRLGAHEALTGFGGAIVMWVVVVAVGTLESGIFGRQPTQTDIRLFQNSAPSLWLYAMALVAVTLAPFAEELIFRGFVFNALWRHFSFVASAITSGLLFGAAHGQVAGIIPLAAGGVVLATVYARTGSLWASMITHGSFNAITLALLLVAEHKT